MQGKIALEEHWSVPETMGDSERLVGTSEGWSDLRRRLLDIHDERLSQMDANGIELSILSLNATAIQAILDPEEAIATANLANNILAEETAKRPDRFRAFAALPMQDADAAAAELTRCVKEFGFVGALVNGFTQREEEDSAIYLISLNTAIFGERWRNLAFLSICILALRLYPAVNLTKAIPGW